VGLEVHAGTVDGAAGHHGIDDIEHHPVRLDASAEQLIVVGIDPAAGQRHPAEMGIEAVAGVVVVVEVHDAVGLVRVDRESARAGALQRQLEWIQRRIGPVGNIEGGSERYRRARELRQIDDVAADRIGQRLAQAARARIGAVLDDDGADGGGHPRRRSALCRCGRREVRGRFGGEARHRQRQCQTRSQPRRATWKPPIRVHVFHPPIP
jgi:hypothetical protein